MPLAPPHAVAHWRPRTHSRCRNSRELAEEERNYSQAQLLDVGQTGRGASDGSKRQEERPMKMPRTAIVTGASQGIGACLVTTLIERGYNVVATSRSMEKSGFQASKQLALVDGDIGKASTAKSIAAMTVERFGGIDTLVNNAGIYVTKPFPDY